MTNTNNELSSILVDLNLPDPPSLSTPLIEVLASLKIELLGWYSVPEQTSPEHAREQFQQEAKDTLKQFSDTFEEAGATVSTHLVFTPDELDTISRISTEQDCDAVLIPAETEKLQRILVPLRGLHNLGRITEFVADLVHDNITDVVLMHVLEEGETAESIRKELLVRSENMMKEQGIQADLIQTEITGGDNPSEEIINRAEDFDAVVLGETKPSIRELLFGTVPEAIAETVQIPVMVIRHQDEEVEAAEKSTQSGS